MTISLSRRDLPFFSGTTMSDESERASTGIGDGDTSSVLATSLRIHQSPDCRPPRADRRHTAMGYKFENLEVWQRSLDYADKIHEIADRLPRHERYNLMEDRGQRSL